MLSYLLDLERKALWSPSPDGLLVIVDDCALSGARFYYALHSVPNERVIFAHLYSPPELRAAILAQEPRVVACVAAHDLRDSARERYPDEAEYKAWQQRWRERLPEPRYWVGLPEPVVFPWSEPERSVWNAETGEVKEGWRLGAPHRCLGNWRRLGLPPRLDAETLHWRLPDRVAHRFSDGEALLCDMDTEQVYGLQGVAADMWRALVGYGNVDTAVAYLLDQYDVDEATLRADLDAFAAGLVAKGLLEQADTP